MPFLTSLIIACIFSALFSGLAAGYIETNTANFHFSAWQTLAGTASSLIALSIYALMRHAKNTSPKSPGFSEEHTGRQSGTVKWFNPKKGFGFITCANDEEVFVHYRNIEGTGRRVLREGESVSFLVVQSDKGPQAEEVRSEA